MEDIYVTCGYYTNKLLEETRRVNCKNYRTMRKHMKEAVDEFTELAKSVSVLHHNHLIGLREVEEHSGSRGGESNKAGKRSETKLAGRNKAGLKYLYRRSNRTLSIRLIILNGVYT